jgi:hypothetical protein
MAPTIWGPDARYRRLFGLVGTKRYGTIRGKEDPKDPLPQPTRDARPRGLDGSGRSPRGLRRNRAVGAVRIGEQTSTSTAETTGGPATAEAASTTTSCVVRPEQTEGPYYVNMGLARSDIREGREGVPLELTFNVSRLDQGDAPARGPLAGAAVVDVWHCDALGEYSGVETTPRGSAP